MNKICPLMSYRNDYSPTSVWCYKEDCAWWNKKCKCCNMITAPSYVSTNDMPIIYGPYC